MNFIRTPLLIESTDRAIRSGQRSVSSMSDDEIQGHVRQLDRQGRAREYFEPYFERIADLTKERDRIAKESRAIIDRFGHDNPRSVEAKRAHNSATARIRDAEFDLGREAHRANHPVGRYLQGITKGQHHLDRLSRVSAPNGRNPGTSHESFHFGNPNGSETSITLPSRSSPHHEGYRDHLVHALGAHGIAHEVSHAESGNGASIIVRDGDPRKGWD